MKRAITVCMAVSLLSGCGEGLVADMQPNVVAQERAVYQDVLDRAFLVAAEDGNVSKIKRLLLDGANVNAHDAFGRSALIKAVAHSRPDAVQVLLHAGAEADWVDVDGWSALFHAVNRNHYVIAQRLIKSGAAVNGVDSQNRRPLFYAEELGSVPLVNLLKSAGAHR